MTETPRFNHIETDRIDDKARTVAARWMAGDIDEHDARRELLRLSLDGPVLTSCVRKTAPAPTPQSRADMHDRMMDLLESKIVEKDEAATPLRLEQIAAGDSLMAWVRKTLLGAGPFLRYRINRDEQHRIGRIARLAREVASDGSEMAWAAPKPTPEELVVEPQDVIVGSTVDLEASGGDMTRAMLLADGREVAARAAAFRAKGSTYRGSRRLNTQVALAAQLMELDPPPRLPLSRWEERQQIRQWCSENGDGSRLRRLLSMRRQGREIEDLTDVEELVLSLFDSYTLAQAAALTSKPGYVLVHMAQAAVEPTPPPPGRVIQQMAVEVGSVTGQTRRAGRLVRTWAAAHAELTVSEYATRGEGPQVKSIEAAQVDLDLFHAEVDKMIGEDEVTDLGSSRRAVRSYLDRLHERVMVAELDAQVTEWVGESDSSSEAADEPSSEAVN